MKTFAQILKDHTDFMEQETDKIQSLRDRAKTALTNGETEKADEFLAEGERCLDVAEKSIREFEASYKAQLEKLKFIAEKS